MYLLFDIGGTKTRIGVSSDGVNLDSSQVISTHQDFESFIPVFKDIAESLSGGQAIQACAGGIRGVLDENKTVLIYDAVLPDWVRKPLKETLQNILRVRVFLENDAALGALGEANKGAGAGFGIVTYITVSTGIGGAKVVNGKLEKQVFGFEPGHQIISLDGMEFEQYISGTALTKEYGMPSEQINDPAVWDEAARRLSIGLNNTILHWSPHIVILGGGLMQRIPIERVRFHLSQTLKLFPKPPEIALSKLGELAGMTGALEYLKQNLKT
ncbi:MAG: glucokinase [Microgenomates group bacterium Gr01-1014_7]|nr:MAG: glucokinase [Microgenomates group bacterium Gr01-1014_7]